MGAKHPRRCRESTSPESCDHTLVEALGLFGTRCRKPARAASLTAVPHQGELRDRQHIGTELHHRALHPLGIPFQRKEAKVGDLVGELVGIRVGVPLGNPDQCHNTPLNGTHDLAIDRDRGSGNSLEDGTHSLGFYHAYSLYDTITPAHSMISIDLCNGHQTVTSLPPQELRACLANNAHALIWVDISNPTEDDWTILTEQFDFHPLALEDARKQDQRPKVDVYADYLFFSMRCWRSDGDGTAELDLFLGHNFLVTIHDEGNLPVAETRLRLARNPTQPDHRPAYLLYLLLDAVVDEYFPAMDALDAKLDLIEEQVYDPRATTTDLAPALKLKKQLLLLRQAVSPLRDVLNHILRIDDTTLFPSELRVFYQDVYDHTLRLVEQVDLHRDILGGVIDATMAQTSNRLNQVMKTMTGISTLLMTVTLIAGIYGMNFANMPELKWQFGYFYALGSMVVVGLIVGLYFKKIKWF